MAAREAPLRPTTLLGVYAALMALLLATWGLSFTDLGRFNLVIALAIGVTKAALVVAVFMELRARQNIVKLFAGLGIFWFGIMLTLTFTDFLWRAPAHP